MRFICIFVLIEIVLKFNICVTRGMILLFDILHAVRKTKLTWTSSKKTINFCGMMKKPTLGESGDRINVVF